MTLHRVFVYGTLKRGQFNHRLMSSAEFLGVATTVDKFILLEGNAPRICRPVGDDAQYREHARSIRGEVYALDDELLARLDRLEGHPDTWRRERVEVMLDGEPGWVDAYVWSRGAEEQLITQPDSEVLFLMWSHGDALSDWGDPT